MVLASGASLCLGAEKKILVYTRNYTPDGKGYVHDNIKASVAAIRKMGKENGFAVDVSDDPNVFTDANLKQYKALVFSNSNNEAFATDEQRAHAELTDKRMLTTDAAAAQRAFSAKGGAELVARRYHTTVD